MILDKNTINTENFCDLTLAEYWEKYRFTIANERGWECKGEGCPLVSGWLFQIMQKHPTPGTYLWDLANIYPVYPLAPGIIRQKIHLRDFLWRRSPCVRRCTRKNRLGRRNHADSTVLP